MYVQFAPPEDLNTHFGVLLEMDFVVTFELLNQLLK